MEDLKSLKGLEVPAGVNKTRKRETENNEKNYFNILKRDIIRDRYLYLLLLPMVIIYVLFTYLPMGGLIIAFKNYSPFVGILESPWVGFDNFIEYFTGAYFVRNLVNTLMINVYSLIFGFPLPIIFALLLNEVRSAWFKKTVQTVSYMPHFISIVVVVGMLTTFLSLTGVVNIFRDRLDLDKIYFLTIPEYFRTIYTSMFIWKETGFGAVIYIAALAGINQELYDACIVDGGGRWRQLWNVTLPGIMNTVMVLLILKIGGLIEVGYEAIILMYQPSTYPTADVISTFIYRTGIESASPRYSLTTAVGLVNSVVALFLVLGANWLSKKQTETGIW
jgi:putative aldouronate transport system permease protein